MRSSFVRLSPKGFSPSENRTFPSLPVRAPRIPSRPAVLRTSVSFPVEQAIHEAQDRCDHHFPFGLPEADFVADLRRVRRPVWDKVGYSGGVERLSPRDRRELQQRVEEQIQRAVHVFGFQETPQSARNFTASLYTYVQILRALKVGNVDYPIPRLIFQDQFSSEMHRALLLRVKRLRQQSILKAAAFLAGCFGFSVLAGPSFHPIFPLLKMGLFASTVFLLFRTIAFHSADRAEKKYQKYTLPAFRGSRLEAKQLERMLSFYEQLQDKQRVLGLRIAARSLEEDSDPEIYDAFRVRFEADSQVGTQRLTRQNLRALVVEIDAMLQQMQQLITEMHGFRRFRKNDPVSLNQEALSLIARASLAIQSS